LTPFLDEDSAKEMEKFYVEDYKNKKWNILNETGAGSLGSTIGSKWTKEICKIEALKYKTRKEMSLKSC
jgi:hypothetical protein